LGSLSTEQYRRAVKLVGMVSEMDEILAEKENDKDYDIVGRLLYTCGAISYHDNDVIEARRFLDRAAQCRAPEPRRGADDK
jgi:hypothetical protein